MKHDCLLAFLILVTTFPALAQDNLAAVAKDIREFMYPVYFYTQGTFYGHTTFQFSTGEADVSVEGEKVGKTDASTTTIGQSLFYGLGDGLGIGAGIRYQLEEQFRFTYELKALGEEKQSSSGFEDPKIEARYQIPMGTKFLTTQLSFSPSLIKQKHSQPDEKGNAGKGKHVVALKADYSSTGPIFWGASANLEYNGEEKSTGADDEIVTTTKPYFELGFDARLGWVSSSRELYPYVTLAINQTPDTKSITDKKDATEEKTTHDLDSALLVTVPYLVREDIKTEFAIAFVFPGDVKSGSTKSDPSTAYALNLAATYTF